MFEVVTENKQLMQAYQSVIRGKPDCWDHYSYHRKLDRAKATARRLSKRVRCQVRDRQGNLIAWGCDC